MNEKEKRKPSFHSLDRARSLRLNICMFVSNFKEGGKRPKIKISFNSPDCSRSSVCFEINKGKKDKQEKRNPNFVFRTEHTLCIRFLYLYVCFKIKKGKEDPKKKTL